MYDRLSRMSAWRKQNLSAIYDGLSSISDLRLKK
jgi:hypothetical protein